MEADFIMEIAPSHFLKRTQSNRESVVNFRSNSGHLSSPSRLEIPLDILWVAIIIRLFFEMRIILIHFCIHFSITLSTVFLILFWRYLHEALQSSL